MYKRSEFKTDAEEQTVKWNPVEWKVKVFDSVSGKIVLERVE